tara:strand:- start:89 stop:262 length:174 start_codon:yes stop_codon:yes gene_type:complete
MNITSAKYLKNLENENSIVKIVADGETLFVPLDEGNRHYAEIKRQVDAGELTIEEAD